MAVWESIADVALTSLLLGLAVVAFAALLNWRFASTRLYKVLLSRMKITLLILVLLILLIPVVFSLFEGTWSSPRVLAIYVRELLVSVVIVVLFSAIWGVLSAPGLWTYFQMNRAQIESLTKMLEGEAAGWYELLEDVKFGQGLRLGARLVVRMVLWSHSSDEYKKQLRLLLSYKSGR